MYLKQKGGTVSFSIFFFYFVSFTICLHLKPFGTFNTAFQRNIFPKHFQLLVTESVNGIFKAMYNAFNLVFPEI